MHVILGKNESNNDLQLGDIERRNGLYILGKPRMGKSWLMVNLAIQDVENANGLFFLDPHGDAISDIIPRIIPFLIGRQHYLLNPEDADYSFSINLLECKHIESQQARSATFAHAKGVFDKLWKSTFEERPWLQLILQNSLYALIENQGYTLAELPLFFRDRAVKSRTGECPRHTNESGSKFKGDCTRYLIAVVQQSYPSTRKHPQRCLLNYF